MISDSWFQAFYVVNQSTFKSYHSFYSNEIWFSVFNETYCFVFHSWFCESLCQLIECGKKIYRSHAYSSNQKDILKSTSRHPCACFRNLIELMESLADIQTLQIASSKLFFFIVFILIKCISVRILRKK